MIGVGLGEDLGDGCPGMDPGLAPYLRGEHGPSALDGLRARWAAATALTGFLYEQKVQDVGWRARVTLRQQSRAGLLTSARITRTCVAGQWLLRDARHMVCSRLIASSASAASRAQSACVATRTIRARARLSSFAAKA